MKNDYSVAGSFYSSQYNYVEIKLRKCKDDPNCKEDDEINDILNNLRFSMAIVNTVVDLKNYEEPIQYVIDDGFYWELLKGIRKKTDIFIRHNEATFEDSYIQMGFPTQKSFYQVVDSESRFESESDEGDVLTVYFRFDK